MKNRKVWLIIIESMIGVLLLVLAGYFIFLGEKTPGLPVDKTKDKLVAPAKDTEELLNKLEPIKTNSVTSDEIIFTEEVELVDKEVVAVWIYSEPKFLGYFEVMVQDGMKKIVGLKEALDKITIEFGMHNIAITKESGDVIGYIDVEIKEDGNLISFEKEEAGVEPELPDEKPEELPGDLPEEMPTDEPTEEPEQSVTTTKNVTEVVEIDFETKEKQEKNMKKGTKNVVQNGSKGEKEITYEVIYDASGNEVSRKKISEKVVKDAINEVVKVGMSDFNINTDTTHGTMSGVLCPESKTTLVDGDLYCDDENYTDLEEFTATILENQIIVTDVGGNSLSQAVMATPIHSSVYTGTYNGVKYYFDNRMGDGEPGKLTMDFCNKHGLSCGEW